MGVASGLLVGRERELTTLLEVVAGASNALVSGPAGVGKTRLLAEFADRLPPGMPCVSISGSEAAAAIPLAPLLQFVPSDSPEPARAILTQFYRRSRESPLVLIVDDAHALDEASAALVHQLCRAEGVPVVAAVRTGEPPPEQIEAIWRDGLAVDVALGPLTTDEIVLIQDGRLSWATPQPRASCCVSSFVPLEGPVAVLLTDGTLLRLNRDDGQALSDRGVRDIQELNTTLAGRPVLRADERIGHRSDTL